MKDCIFCQIVSGKQDSQKVLETELSFSFLDVNPLSDGHTVVIPKNHYERFSDIPPGEVADLMEAVQVVNRAVQKAMEAPGANIGINDGRQAGQAVPHSHVHVIPRYHGDGGQSFHSLLDTEPSQDLTSIVERIRGAL